MKIRNVSYFIIIFSIMITLAGCNRIEAIEFEGLNISTNDNFHLIKGELYVKEKWSFSEKKKVLNIIQRMTPRDEVRERLLGMGPVLRIENGDYSILIVFNERGRHTAVYIEGGITEEVKWYICSEDDFITIGSFIFPKSWINDLP